MLDSVGSFSSIASNKQNKKTKRHHLNWRLFQSISWNYKVKSENASNATFILWFFVFFFSSFNPICWWAYQKQEIYAHYSNPKKKFRFFFRLLISSSVFLQLYLSLSLSLFFFNFIQSLKQNDRSYATTLMHWLCMCILIKKKKILFLNSLYFALKDNEGTERERKGAIEMLCPFGKWNE